MQTPALLALFPAAVPVRAAGAQTSACTQTAKVIAFFDEEVLGWHGVHQAYQVLGDFMSDGILLTAVNLPPSLVALGLPDHGRDLGAVMAGDNHMITAGPCRVEDTGSGRVRNVPGLGPQVFYQLNGHDAERIVRGIALTAELMFAAGARRVMLPFDGAPEVCNLAGSTDVLARPVPTKSIELFTVHLMGTARMSDNPKRGVVDSFGAFHGVPGLFVADASLFPSPIGVNPLGNHHGAGHAQRPAPDRTTHPARNLKPAPVRRKRGLRGPCLSPLPGTRRQTQT